MSPRVTTRNFQHQPRTEQSHVRIDMSLFEPPFWLEDEHRFQRAVAEFERHLQRSHSDEDLFNVLGDVMEYHEHLLEYLLSIISEESLENLVRRLTDTFPSSANDYLTTFTATLLLRLSRSCQSFELIYGDYYSSERRVELISQALRALASSAFPDDTRTLEDESPIFSRRRVTPTFREKIKRRAPIIDRSPFEKLEIDVPRTKSEAALNEQVLLEEQKSTLQLYLRNLRNFADDVKHAYLQRCDVVHEVPDVSEYPRRQSKDKEASYFKPTAEGFGEWRMMLSRAARKDINDYDKKYRNRRDILMTKLKELSHGQFTYDNHKRLVLSDPDIPTYEAKVTGDTRLIYGVHIDCFITDDGFEEDWQVLYIIKICTHAQMDDRMWALGRHVSMRKGTKEWREYVRRISFRRDPIHEWDKNKPPMSWPIPVQVFAVQLRAMYIGMVELSSSTSSLSDEGEELSDGDELPPDSDEGEPEPRELLEPDEEYVPLSQEFLDSIYEDEDDTDDESSETSQEEQEFVPEPAPAFIGYAAVPDERTHEPSEEGRPSSSRIGGAKVKGCPATRAL